MGILQHIHNQSFWNSKKLQIKAFLLCIFIFLWYKALFNNDQRFSYNMAYDIQTSSQNKCVAAIDDLKLRYINVNEDVAFGMTEKENEHLKDGGFWSPTDCIPRQKLAVFVPYRDRLSHIRKFLFRIHPMLKRQKVQYKIFVISQSEENDFNRGLLFNIGVIEALKENKFDCFVFSDVDLVPEHDGNLYLCDDGVRHLSSAIDTTRYHVMFWNYAGGVAAISKDNFLKINGYPNVYWGWGNEDDDFSARTLLSGMILSRPPESIGRYKMLKHVQASRSKFGYWLFRSFRGRWKYDGLNSVVQVDPKWNIEHLLMNQSNFANNNPYVPFKTPYQILNIARHKLFTNISVRVGKPAIDKLYDSPYTWESWYWTLHFYGWI